MGADRGEARVEGGVRGPCRRGLLTAPIIKGTSAVIAFVVDPVSCLLQHLMYARLDQRPFDAEVFIGRTVGPCPAPNIAEHPAMKAACERLADRVSPTQGGPCSGFENILLLQLIQLAAQRYMGRDKAFAFLGRERCGTLRLVEGAVHYSSHIRAGRRISFSTSRWWDSWCCVLSLTPCASNRIVCSTEVSCRSATMDARLRIVSARDSSGTRMYTRRHPNALAARSRLFTVTFPVPSPCSSSTTRGCRTPRRSAN